MTETNLSSGAQGQETPRWTLPPRKEISPENLHISSFVVIRREGDQNSLLLLRAGDKHSLSFRRGKLNLPGVILRYGEKPREGARRALRDQLSDSAKFNDPEFLEMQSYLGAHWDLVLVFQTQTKDGASDILPREPFTHAAFYDQNKLPRAEIAEDHLEVIDEILNPSEP